MSINTRHDVGYYSSSSSSISSTNSKFQELPLNCRRNIYSFINSQEQEQMANVARFSKGDIRPLACVRIDPRKFDDAGQLYAQALTQYEASNHAAEQQAQDQSQITRQFYDLISNTVAILERTLKSVQRQ